MIKESFDWNIIIAITSVLALILSQLPPVFSSKRSKLKFEIYNSVSIFHNIGYPTLSFPIKISNIGGRNIYINDIKAKIYRNDKLLTTLPCHTFSLSSDMSKYALLSTINLKRSKEWDYVVHLNNFPNNSDDVAIRTARSKIKKSLHKYPNQMNSMYHMNNNLSQRPTIPEETLKPLYDIFEREFIWMPGDYTLDVFIETSNKKTDISKKYQFSLFDIDTEVLSSVKDDYKYGDVILWNSNKHTPVYLQFKEI